MKPEELADIDRRVAEAIGGELWLGFDQHDWNFDGHKVDVNRWNPSTDWNSAMFAAEKAGLMDGDKRLTLYQRDNTYHADVYHCNGLFVYQTEEAESGTLAICKAILALKEGK